MKKLLSILLVVAMVMTFAVPAMAAEESAVTVTLPDELSVSTWYRAVHVDEETQSEWGYYYWDSVLFDAAINGEPLEQTNVNTLVITLGKEFSAIYGDTVSCDIKDGQSPETPWEVGGTYPVELSFFYHDVLTDEEITVWSHTMNVTTYDRPVSAEISQQTTVTTADSEIVYNEETQKEFTYYHWYDQCRFDATVNGVEYTNISFDGLQHAFYEQYGERVRGGIADTQHVEEWTVGNTYTATLMITSSESHCTIWESDIQVTLVEPSVDIEINSDLEIDELTGQLHGASDGSSFLYYDYTQHGLMDVTIDGTAYPSVSVNEMRLILSELYGEVSVWFAFTPSYDGENFDQYEKPWQAGDAFTVEMFIRLEDSGELLYGDDLTIRVCETEIASVSIAPISYYVYQLSGDPEITANYKDGTSAVTDALYYRYVDWPEEPGTYTMNFIVAETFTVPVQVTVLENPTSGKLGDTVTWTYDEATKTMTLSGTGAADVGDLSDWVRLYLTLLPEHVVVEEGIETLPEGIFHYSLGLLDITLPTTLKEIPNAFVGFNGPTAGTHYEAEFGDLQGMTAIAIPEGITSLTNSAFYTCWGISDYYLPSTLKEIDIDVLCQVSHNRKELGLPALNTTIHFAGTEAQWAEVKHVVGSTRKDYGTGLTDAELEELFATFTVVFEPKETITVENGTATVPDGAVEIVEGEDVVIDVTDTEEEVSSVVIGSETVDKLADAETSVEIKLTDATVSFDKDAIDSISEQAGENAVTIVCKEVEESTLTAQQKAALQEKEVCLVLTLEAFAGETKITDFGGGKVTISVPFTLPEGKAGTDFYVAYVAEDGTITAVPTTYANGVLTFTTTHFSSYVVLENVTVKPGTGNNPPTGDNSPLLLLVVLTVASAACLTVCVTKRKIF